MTKRILIAPAGWEERYFKGVLVDIDQFKPNTILIPYSSCYKNRTEKIRADINAYAIKSRIEYVEKEIDYQDSIVLYKSIWELISQLSTEGGRVRLNATTAPRDVIWYVLHFLSISKTPTEFSYFRPLGYGDYLSRDAQAPRLVLKKSGVSFPDKPTCILVLDGFDVERKAQLRNRYEPKVMLIGRQTGDQLDNLTRNASNLSEPTEGEVYFDFDCYDTSEASVKILETNLAGYVNDYNIIAASLGPKPSALTLFNLTRKMPDIGLAYIPANDYSENYSSGLNESELITEVIW